MDVRANPLGFYFLPLQAALLFFSDQSVTLLRPTFLLDADTCEHKPCSTTSHVPTFANYSMFIERMEVFEGVGSVPSGL